MVNAISSPISSNQRELDPFSSPIITGPRIRSALKSSTGISPEFKNSAIKENITHLFKEQGRIKEQGRKYLATGVVSALSKQHFKKIKSGFSKDQLEALSKTKKAKKIPYGEQDITKKIIEYRKQDLSIGPGRNFAMVLFKTEDNVDPVGHTVAHTKGKRGSYPHAEMMAIDKLPPKIRENPQLIYCLYTERKPCTGPHRRDCELKISIIAGSIKILYSFDDDKEAQKTIKKVVNYSKKRKLEQLAESQNSSMNSSQDLDSSDLSFRSDSEQPSKKPRFIA